MRDDDGLLTVVLAERYGPSKWWTRRPSPPTLPDRFPEDGFRDDEVTCARRRRALVEAYEDERAVG